MIGALVRNVLSRARWNYCVAPREARGCISCRYDGRGSIAPRPTGEAPARPAGGSVEAPLLGQDNRRSRTIRRRPPVVAEPSRPVTCVQWTEWPSRRCPACQRSHNRTPGIARCWSRCGCRPSRSSCTRQHRFAWFDRPWWSPQVFTSLQMASRQQSHQPDGSGRLRRAVARVAW